MAERNPEAQDSAQAQDSSLTDNLSTIRDQQRLEEDVARDVAYAGKTDRSEAAFERRGAALKDQYKQQYTDARRAGDSRDASLEERQASRADAKSVLRGVAGELNEIKDTYPEFVRSRGSDQYDQINAREAGYFLDAVDDGGLFGRPSESRAEVADKRAERKEFWAEKLYDRPDIGYTVEQCISAEKYLEQNGSKPDLLRAEVDKIRALAEEGEYGIAETIKGFELVYGKLQEGQEPSPRQQEFSRLLHDDEATVGQIRGFLESSILESAQEWVDTLSQTQAKLDEIAGKASVSNSESQPQ